MQFFLGGGVGGLSKVHLRHYWEKKSVYAVVHFVNKVTFIFLLFFGTGTVTYANEVETNEKM